MINSHHEDSVVRTLNLLKHKNDNTFSRDWAKNLKSYIEKNEEPKFLQKQKKKAIIAIATCATLLGVGMVVNAKYVDLGSLWGIKETLSGMLINSTNHPIGTFLGGLGILATGIVAKDNFDNYMDNLRIAKKIKQEQEGELTND